MIEANYIEGRSPNITSGVITCLSNSKVLLRNAKIKNVSTSNNSIGIYIPSSGTHEIEIENLTVVTSDLTTGKTIFRNGSTLDVKNLLVFLNFAAININFIIGTTTNKKVIVDPVIT